MSFGVLPVTVNLNGLATGTMKVNCDHETTLKASIISLIQLIGGITVYRSDSLRKGRATTKQQTDYGGNYFFYHPLPRKQRPFFGNSGELWRIENGLWRDHSFLKRNIIAVTFFELCLNLWAAQVELFQLLLFAHAHSQRILINLPHYFRTVLAIFAPLEAEIIRFAEITFCRLRQFLLL